MPRIDRIETLILDIPTVRAHVLSVATMRRQSIVLIRLYCSDGIVGLGEATTIGGLSYGEESPEGIKLAIDTYFQPILLEGDAARPAAVMQTLGRAIVGNHFAKSGVEIALLDAQAQRAGLPVSELLGGRVRDDFPVAWTLASGETERDIDEARRMLDLRRHDIFKLKIGKRALADDLRHVAAIKRALGDRASVRVDVNQAWSESEALRASQMLAEAGIDLIEQPIARANRAGMARLAARSLVPIMADEALHGPEDAFDIAAGAAAHVFAVKLSPSGGPVAAGRVASIANAAGIGLYGGTMLEAGIGTIASAHLFATLPGLDWGTELFGPLLLTAEILTEPLAYGDFRLKVPDVAGLGVALDEDKVAFFRRDRTTHTVGPSLARV